MMLPSDYAERVYAGILGKMIGVFLGRPIETWTNEQIQERFGEVRSYLNEAVERPLIVPDDDLSGTFTFLRALEDNGYPRNLSSQQIGEAWLNYIVEGRTNLWWGGMGNSTEQTAYIRLKQGIPAPRSGSMELNTQLIAEQIGAQIFIDSWAMVAPGDPNLAFHLATEAARVSHDGEAVYASQVLAVMESLAFVEPNVNRLLEAGLSYVPKESAIHRMISDLSAVRQNVNDWREARAWLEAHYGYDKYGGNVHVVPNHGVIILSMLYGQDDFLETLMIANTCGWDTDCNAGNVGCLMGIKLGLKGIETVPHLRQPLADRLFVSSAEGSRSVTNAVALTDEVVRAGHKLAGLEYVPPKHGAQFHFEYPGSLQGFVLEGSGCLQNVAGHSPLGERSLEFSFELDGVNPSRIYTRTFLPPEVPEPPIARYDYNQGGGWNYMLLASPRFYPGQTLRVGLCGEANNHTTVGLFFRYYDATDQLVTTSGPQAALQGNPLELSWVLPDHSGPIVDVGLEVWGTGKGQIFLDYLAVNGEPCVRLTRPPEATGGMWRRAWVNAVDRYQKRFPEPYRLLQMAGLGQLSIGSRDWQNYSVRAKLTPYLAKQAGLAVRWQGLNRYYAAMLVKPNLLQIVKCRGRPCVLAQTQLNWTEGTEYEVVLQANGQTITAEVGGVKLEANDSEQPLASGGIALLIEEGWLSSEDVVLSPVQP